LNINESVVLIHIILCLILFVCLSLTIYNIPHIKNGSFISRTYQRLSVQEIHLRRGMCYDAMPVVDTQIRLLVSN